MLEDASPSNLTFGIFLKEGPGNLDFGIKKGQHELCSQIVVCWFRSKQVIKHLATLHDH